MLAAPEDSHQRASGWFARQRHAALLLQYLTDCGADVRPLHRSYAMIATDLGLTTDQVAGAKAVLTTDGRITAEAPRHVGDTCRFTVVRP